FDQGDHQLARHQVLDVGHLDAQGQPARVVGDHLPRVDGQLHVHGRAGVGEVAVLGDDQPGEGFVVPEGQFVAEGPLDLVDVHVAVDPPPVLALGGDDGIELVVVLVGELTHQLLGQVLQGDDAGEAAVRV